MSKITFGPPALGSKKVLGGLGGGTGSGKTFSALEIGTGLVSDPATKLFVIDTECGRAADYFGQFAFQYGQLPPPFTAARYIEAIDSAVTAGAECVIVDSASHMWEGEGGAREQAAAIAKKMAARSGGYPETYTFPSWNDPKAEITKFVLYLQKRQAHLILCFRAKEKSTMVKRPAQDGKVKTEIVSLGLQPIMEDGVPYECDFLAMLSQDDPGVPHWTHKALASYLQDVFADGGKLSREHGRRLAKWREPPPPSGEHAESRPPAATTAAGPPFDDNGSRRHDGPATGSASPRASAGQQSASDWKERGKAITDTFKRAQTMDELNRLEAMHRAEIDAFPVAAKSRVAAVFHEMREKLMAQEPAPQQDARSFHDEIADLEPDEWKNAEGRVDDPRQPELIA